MAKIAPFILGGIIGAGAAIMLAPKAGEETRAYVAEKANAVWGEVQDFGAGMPESAQDVYKTVREKANDLVKTAQEMTGTATAKSQDLASDAAARVQGAASKAAPTDSDELREKIEAARRRIAAQVMENAEQSKAVDVTAAEEAVEEAAVEATDAAAEATGAAEEASAE